MTEDLRLRPCLAVQGWDRTAPDRDPTVLLAADDAALFSSVRADRAARTDEAVRALLVDDVR